MSIINKEALKFSYYEKCIPGLPSQFIVSLCEFYDKPKSTLVDCLSPSNFIGVGDCFDVALGTYVNKLNEYINALCHFRDEVINTGKYYDKSVQVDYLGNPI